MADDGWITVGAKKKTAAPKPKAQTGLSPIPAKATSSAPAKKFGPTSTFTSTTSYGSGQKYGAGTNKKATAGPSARKIEEEAEFGEGSMAAKKIDHAISENIQRARTAKNWTQKDLAREIHESPDTVRNYENGKATPNGMVLTKMEKALGVKIR